MALDLTSIRPTGETWVPLKCLVHGVQGVGKTTLACTFEAPILVPVEDGLAAIEGVPAFPRLTSYQDAVDVIQALHGEHAYKTVVVDSLDWLEPLIHAQTCAVHQMGNIEEFGYGKGYVAAGETWRYLLGGLDSLRLTRGMNIILIAHTEIKRFDAPDVDSYDRYQIKLHRGAAALFEEWADLVLFVNYKTSVRSVEGSFGKSLKKGVGTGDRIIYTSERPSHKAKSRWPLPAEIFIGQDPTWAGLHAALVEATKGRYPMPSNLSTVKE